MITFVNQYQTSEKEWRRETKAPKKQNKMLLRISKLLGSRRELKKVNKIRTTASKRHGSSKSDSSSSDSDSPLSSDSKWDKRIQYTERKDMKNLDHVVTNNIRNKYQYNDAI